MSRAHIENVLGAALGLLGVIAAPLMAADDWIAGGWIANGWVAGSWMSAPPTFFLDVLIWGAGAVVLYLYGVRGTGGGRW